MQNIFKDEEEKSEEKNNIPQQPEENNRPAEEKKQPKEEKKAKKTTKKQPFFNFGTIFDGWTNTVKKTAKDFVDNATKEEDDYINDDEEDKNY